MILNSKTKKKHFKLWTLRRNWYRLSLYYFSRKRRSLLHPKTVKSSFSRLKSYSWKTLGKIAPKSSLRCWVSVSDGAPAPSASHIGKKKLNIKWLNGRCWIQILTVFDSVNYQQFFFFTFTFTSPFLGSQKRKKKHGQIRVKRLFIPCDDKLIFWSNEPLSSFVELLSFKSYNIATNNLCRDHVLTTKHWTAVFYY